MEVEVRRVMGVIYTKECRLEEEPVKDFPEKIVTI